MVGIRYPDDVQGARGKGLRRPCWSCARNQVARAKSDTDPTGQPIMLRPCRGSTNSNDFYIKGTNGAAAVVKITINKTFCVNGATTSGDPRRVDVSVETPGSSPSTNRTTFLYTGIVPPG